MTSISIPKTKLIGHSSVARAKQSRESNAQARSVNFSSDLPRLRTAFLFSKTAYFCALILN